MLTEILADGAAKQGVCLPAGALEQFETYDAMLEETNQVMNLTAITGPENVARLHFLDSLALAAQIRLDGARMIDVGSGAGFPGVPLKIAVPSLRLTILDAQKKRVEFVSRLCMALRLESVECLHGRAEETSFSHGYRDGYDFAVSRAVANLSMLCELCLPFVKPGGSFLAMKGTDSDEELQAAENAMKTLGACLEGTADYQIPGTDIVHRIVTVKKTAPTPKGYPRRFAKIQKEPL